MFEPAKRFAVQDSVPIMLKRRPHRTGGLRTSPTSGLFAVTGMHR
jgi:hypothetical protein